MRYYKKEKGYADVNKSRKDFYQDIWELNKIITLYREDPEACLEAMKHGFPGINKSTINVHIIDLLGTMASFYTAYTDEIPIHTVSEGLLKAMEMTSVPKDVTLQDLDLPYSSGIYMIPMGCLKIRKQNVTMIQYTKLDRNQKTGNNPYCIMIYSDDNLKLNNHSLVVNEDTPLFSVYTIDSSLENAACPELDSELKNILSILFNLISLHVEPSIALEAPKRIESKKKRSKRKGDLFKMGVIGQNYYIKTEGDVNLGGSMRSHWRRGHWRHQGYGANRSQIRLKWIEPMLINKDKIAS
jgi:hypothetical protein